MLRWLLRIFLTLLALIVLAAIAVQIVLWTSLPKTLVINQVQKELKLSVTCQKLTTSWTGHTTLTDVTVSLPLASGSFLKLAELKVHHASLIALLLGRPMDVKDLELDKAQLVVRQDAAGRWNLQDVLELVRRAAGSEQAQSNTEQSSKPQAYALPQITVSDASIEVINRLGKEALIEPINAHGTPQGPLVYTYDLAVGKVRAIESSKQNADVTHSPIHITGKIVPGGVWQHEMNISIHDLGPWLAPFVEPSLADKLATVAFTGHWRGGVYGQAVIGRLDVDHASGLAMSAHGAIDLTMQGGAVTAKPDNLLVNTGVALVPTVQLTEGSVYSDGAIIRAKGLIAQLAAGRIKIDGNFDFLQRSADLAADWDKVIAPSGLLTGFVQSGSVIASYRQTWAGQTVITGNVTTSGSRSSDGKQWNVEAKLSGEGSFATQFVWTLTASKLRLAEGMTPDQKSLNLDGLTASVLQAGSGITLQSLAIPPGMLGDRLARGTLDAHGAFDEAAKAWSLTLHGRNWKWRGDGLAFDVKADGDEKAAHIEKLAATYGKIRLTASGTFSARPKGTSLDIECTYPPFNLEQYRIGIPLHGGEFASELHLSGDLSPLNLVVTGQLHGKDLMLAGRRVGDFSMHLSQAHIDLKMAVLEPTTIDLFGGHWLVRGQYRFAGNAPSSQPAPAEAGSTPSVEQSALASVVAELKGMSLTQVDEFFSRPPKIQGTLSGTWTATMRDNDLNQLDISGPFHLKNVSARGFTAARVDGQVRVSNGQVTISPIVALKTENPDDGKIDAGVSFAIHSPLVLRIPATVVGWPIVLAGETGLAAARSRAGDGSHQRPASAPANNARPPATRPATPPADGAPPMVRGDISAPIILAIAGGPSESAAARTAAARPATSAAGNALIARVWGHVDMQLDTRPFSIQGPITGGRILLERGRENLIDLQAEGSISDEQLIIDSLHGTAIGGTIEGSAAFFLTGDKIFQSRAHIGFGGIDASRIVELVPRIEGLAGVFGGSVDLSPTTDPRALGKSRLDAKINAAGAHWRSVHIGDASLTAYFDREPPGPISPEGQTPSPSATKPSRKIPNPGAASLASVRAVLDDSHFDIAGGTLQLWARYARPDDVPFINAQIHFTDLELNQLTHAGDNVATQSPPARPTDAKSYPGKLSGSVAIFGDPRRPKDLFGQGSIKLTHTDLAATNIIGALYNIMSLHFGHGNQGYGSADFRLDAGQLPITRFYYFNQGLEAHGDATIYDFWHGLKDARIKGQVVGSIRPLRDLKLPFAADADKILSVLQSNVTTLAIEGSLRNPQVHPLAFSDISDALRQILVGDTEHNPQQ